MANLGGLLRISPTFNNTADEVRDVVEKTIDVVSEMQAGRLSNHTHLRRYS